MVRPRPLLLLPLTVLPPYPVLNLILTPFPRPLPPPGHPFLIFAAVGAGASIPPPLIPESDHIASVQQADRALDHRKLSPILPQPQSCSCELSFHYLS